MVLDSIPQSHPVHFFGSRPQPPTSPDAPFARDKQTKRTIHTGNFWSDWAPRMRGTLRVCRACGGVWDRVWDSAGAEIETRRASFCRSFPTKEPLNIGHFCEKWPNKIRDPMSLIQGHFNKGMYIINNTNGTLCREVGGWGREPFSRI